MSDQGHMAFWTPQFWKGYFEVPSPYRRYKLHRDTQLATELLELREGDLVLEAGCGYGRISQALLERDHIRLVAIDISDSMIEYCRANVRAPFHSLLADTMVLPFKDTAFNAVLCNGVLMHISDQLAALREFARVLRPGGRLVISGNNLLSPLFIPMIVRTRFRRQAQQSFKSPWFYLQSLENLGFDVQVVTGDTILAVGVVIPVLRMLLPPARLFPLLVLPDKLINSSLAKYLTYELWFSCVKK